MESDKDAVLRRIVDSIFWGDYLVDVSTIKQKIEEDDSDFIRFLVSRIVSDSPSPSSHLLALFPPEKALALLSEISSSGRTERRRSLAKAIISNSPWECEPQWLRNPIL